jgi:hypothetical protein
MQVVLQRMRSAIRTLLLTLLLTLAACGPWPEVPEPSAGNATATGNPDFVPFETVALENRQDDAGTDDTEDVLEARVADLKRRADLLRQAEVGD